MATAFGKIDTFINAIPFFSPTNTNKTSKTRIIFFKYNYSRKKPLLCVQFRRLPKGLLGLDGDGQGRAFLLVLRAMEGGANAVYGGRGGAARKLHISKRRTQRQNVKQTTINQSINQSQTWLSVSPPRWEVSVHSSSQHRHPIGQSLTVCHTHQTTH